MSYLDHLRVRAKKVNSIVCMGMDPIIEKIPIKGDPCRVIEEFYIHILKEMNKIVYFLNFCIFFKLKFYFYFMWLLRCIRM